MYEIVKAWWSFMKRWETAPPHDKESWQRFVDDETEIYDRIKGSLNENEEKLLLDMLVASAEYFRRKETQWNNT